MLKKVSHWRWLLIAVVTLEVLANQSSVSEAAQWRSIEFVDQFKAGDADLRLRGMGIKKYFMFRVFIAAFYLPESTRSEDALTDVSRRLEVEYFVAVPGDQLAKETRRMIAASVTPQEYEQISSRLDLMDKYFVDLRPGDRYCLTYIKGQGTQFFYNGKLQGTIEGADFSSALFCIWIGKKPFDRFLKDKLLGATG